MTDTDTVKRVRRHLEGIIGVPATEGNAIEVLRNGDEIFPSMLDAVDQAQHTIDFLTFVYWEGEIGQDFANRLSDRARDGVRVRVLLDAFGARTMDRSLIGLMQRSGVLVRWFRPLHHFPPGRANHRTHRKVMIVDEEVGFTGGVGIADEWRGDARNEHEWRDTHFRVRGPSVDGLRAAFLGNWAETDPVLYVDATDRFPDQPQAGQSVVQCVRSASETGLGDVDTLFRTLLQLASQRVRIATAYFAPDEDLINRLCETADRDVAVEILLPGPHADKRLVQVAGERLYDRLLASGVVIWNYQPTMLHAKVMTVDGYLSNIGSANLNSRSIALDEEVNLVVLDLELTAVLDDQFDSDVDRSKQIEEGRWKGRPRHQRIVETVVAPVKRLF